MENINDHSAVFWYELCSKFIILKYRTTEQWERRRFYQCALLPRLPNSVTLHPPPNYHLSPSKVSLMPHHTIPHRGTPMEDRLP